MCKKPEKVLDGLYIVALDLNKLEMWFQGRPNWLQEAARRLVQKETLTDEDITELLEICISEAAGEKVNFCGITPGCLNFVDTTKPLHLTSISDVQGINALSPSKPLEFGESQLCIVYGRNAAGKSGYVRLLKHACGARTRGFLLGNVFEKGEQSKTATFTYSEDNQTKPPCQWTGETDA